MKFKSIPITSSRKSILAVLLLGIIAMALAGTIVYASTTLILAVGTIANSQLFGGPATVTVRTLTIPPGEVGAWHFHPGRAYNVIKQGKLTVEDGCGGADETLLPGEAFEEVDGRVHRAKNFGTEDVVVYNTFIVPQGQPTTLNIPNNERRCGPPESADECKLGGWSKFNHPVSFSNERDCILAFNHRPNTLNANRNTTADFDGDGRADLSVFRPSEGRWFVIESSTGVFRVQSFGVNGDKIVPGDYDGDGRTDFAVFRPSNSSWYVLRSSNDSFSVLSWGLSTDKPAPADYDGDGRTDVAVYRDGAWYIIQSSNGQFVFRTFGTTGDTPVAGANVQ